MSSSPALTLSIKEQKTPSEREKDMKKKAAEEASGCLVHTHTITFPRKKGAETTSKSWCCRCPRPERGSVCWAENGQREREKERAKHRFSSARNACWWIGHPWLIWQADFLVFGDWQGAAGASAPRGLMGPLVFSLSLTWDVFRSPYLGPRIDESSQWDCLKN